MQIEHLVADTNRLFGLVLERFNRPAAAQQEGIGDKLERGQIDVGFAGRGKFEEAPVELGILGLDGFQAEFAVDKQFGSARRQPDRSFVGIDFDVPGLRAGLAEVEIGEIGNPAASEIASLAAIGASQLAGNARSADLTNSGCARIRVRIESALMPGSNTPRPPGCQIHA